MQAWKKNPEAITYSQIPSNFLLYAFSQMPNKI